MKPLAESLPKKKKQLEEIQNNLRFAPVHPSKATEFAEWHRILLENFPDLAFPAEIGLSVIAQLLVKDVQNPFGLVYVDVPSSGKTTLLGFFSGLEGITIRVDNFTPASFVSHYAKKKKAELEKTDLLPLIRYRTLLLPDLAPIFSKRDDDRQALLGILTRVMDDQGLETSSGAHGTRGYIGEYPFMLLGASTPISGAVWRSMGTLGARLFFAKVRSKEKSISTLADQLRYPVREKERVCKQTTGDFIKTLWEKHPRGIEWQFANEEQPLLEAIGTISSLLALARGIIQKESLTDGQMASSMSERPDRANQWLYNLARGHAVIQEREQINWLDIKVVFRVAIDSMPNHRSKCLIEAIRRGGEIDSEALMAVSGYSRTYSLKVLEEMVMLGVLKETKVQNETSGRPRRIFAIPQNLAWLLSSKATELISELIN